MRQVAYAARVQVIRKVLRRRVSVPLGTKGGRVWVERDHRGGSYVALANPPDWPHMLVWERRLRPGDLFLDVGANVGIYAVLAASTGAQVVAVEAAAETVPLLRRNNLLNGERIEIVEAAASDRRGCSRFTAGRDQQNRLDPAGEQVVTLTTVDDLLGDRAAAGVKLDVEGNELSCLLGAVRALRARRIALLQIEWNWLADRAPIEALLAQFGYALRYPTMTGDLVPCAAGRPHGDVFALAPTVSAD